MLLTNIYYYFACYYVLNFIQKGDHMKRSLLMVIALLFITGCSGTWEGAKEDTSKAVDWTKEKVN